MKVIKIAPRGYCHGVVSALNIVTSAAHDDTIPRPIYVLGMIVHNEHITKALDELGVITLDSTKDRFHKRTRLELLEEIESGTVIFTAHGVSPQVLHRAKQKGLHCIDGSCKDVIKTQDIIKEHLGDGFDVIYIGKKGHPETEGCLGISIAEIHLVEKPGDIANLEIANKKIIITNQTTMSSWDVNAIADEIKAKFPTSKFIKEICNATLIRQEAVLEQANGADLTIVVGDPKSNNTKRLVQISEEMAKTPAIRIGSLEELDLNLLGEVRAVAVTSGASTPTAITKEVIQFLEKYDPSDPLTHDTTSKINSDKILIRRSKKN